MLVSLKILRYDWSDLFGHIQCTDEYNVHVPRPLRSDWLFVTLLMTTCDVTIY